MAGKKSFVTSRASRFLRLTGLTGRVSSSYTGQRLKELYAPLLDDLDHQVQTADLGADKGVHHRVFAAPLTQEQADRLCRELKKRKVWCVPQRF